MKYIVVALPNIILGEFQSVSNVYLDDFIKINGELRQVIEVRNLVDYSEKILRVGGTFENLKP